MENQWSSYASQSPTRYTYIYIYIYKLRVSMCVRRYLVWVNCDSPTYLIRYATYTAPKAWRMHTIPDECHSQQVYTYVSDFWQNEEAVVDLYSFRNGIIMETALNNTSAVMPVIISFFIPEQWNAIGSVTSIPKPSGRWRQSKICKRLFLCIHYVRT